MMDSILFEQEWQRVAVDKAPTPSDQLADILRKVEIEEMVAFLLDQFPFMSVTDLHKTPPTLYFNDLS